MCRGRFKLQRCAAACGVGVNTNDELTGACNGIAISGVGDIGVGDDPTIFPKPDNETYRNGTSVVIGMNKSGKNG